jgi:ribose 5-phosphate isomerase B
MNNNHISIASDHAGFELKQDIIIYLENKGFVIKDFGTDSLSSCDYPDYIHPLAEDVINHKNKGIVICGSGNGVNITANKHKGVRSALCWLPEIAELARLHNNANVIALPARFISKELAIEIIEKYLNTDFEGGRHQNRVDKIES